MLSATPAHGSSPLSRGIPISFCLSRPRPRIIPALAGNTFAYHLHIPSLRDHPRSRGEYSHTPANSPLTAGSSPLSRGILWKSRPSRMSTRIIPALAGNTSCTLRDVAVWKDHPRSRGEYGGLPWISALTRGSSPLSRGILYFLAGSFRLRRIIPALAGNTKSCISRPSPRKDHPRSRGEYKQGSLMTRQ